MFLGSISDLILCFDVDFGPNINDSANGTGLVDDGRHRRLDVDPNNIKPTSQPCLKIAKSETMLFVRRPRSRHRVYRRRPRARKRRAGPRLRSVAKLLFCG